ncbi:unnamed protein product [Rotaria socialis]|uniref:Wax synthase domain-containing protein n=1 Tax=Rotaria socialis TaxID=392032 RepID=A0A821KW86_9BILA|nr:unnamed protein product [Rotaria socialis]CAF4739973.1 unnamed protein product [Rotaria socialis]
MSSQIAVPISWFIHFITCHYIIRRVPSDMVRMVLTLLPCVLLTYISCNNLPQYQMSSLITTSVCWMVSIRIIQSIVFSPNEACPLYSFILKPFWTIFPVIPSAKMEKQWPIVFDFISGLMKLIINQWIFRWLIRCEPRDNYSTTIMLSIMILTSSHISDIQIGFVRLITRDKYTLFSISNYPLFSKSLREFWGRRYNRLASTVFNECIFQPISACSSSPMLAAMTTFIVSGLLHVHVNLVILNDTRTIIPTFAFFFLNGVACCIEKRMAIRLPAPLGWFLTHCFLLITLPLSMGPYARQGPIYFEQNLPPLFDSKWIPKLPVPDICLG